MGDVLDPSSSNDSVILPGEPLDSAPSNLGMESGNSSTPRQIGRRKHGSIIRYTGLGLLCLGIIAASFILLHKSPDKQTPVNARLSSNADQRFNVQTLPSATINQLSTTSNNIAASPTLSINGKLQANNSLIVTPSSQPVNAVAGQVYYNKTINELGYYNGLSYTYLGGSQTSVTSLGGVSGTIAVGPGLNQSNNQLVNTGVLSLQGQTGSVTLIGGAGISVSGVAFTNTGVIAIGGKSGSISLGNGLNITNGTLESSGVVSIAAGSPNITVADDGNGNVTISSNGAGTGNVSAAGGNAGVIAEFNGAESLTNSLLSQSGSTITVSGALNVTSGLTLGSPLGVDYGGTGSNSLAANGVLIGNGTSTISSLVAGTTNECLTSTTNAPVWLTCPGGNVTASGGTSGSIPIFTGSNSLSASQLSESGSTVSLTGTLSATNLSGNGTNVTNVNAATLQGNAAAFFTNATDISTGTLSDNRLSANVPLLNAATNNFTGTNLEHNSATVCDNSDNCGYLSGAAASSTFVELQGSTPGTAQTGNFNISGTGIAGSLKATTIYQNGNQVCDTSGNCVSGGTSAYFTNASDITSGTLADNRLSTNVALLNATTNNFTGTNLEHGGNNVCDSSNNCGYLTSSTANGSYIELQGSTPGTAQTGNFNISGTGIANSLLVSTGGYVDTSSSGALNLGTNTANGINVGSFTTTSTVGLKASTINIGVNGASSYTGVVNILSMGGSSSTYTTNIGNVTAGVSNIYIGAATGATTTSTLYLQGTGVTQAITGNNDTVQSLTNATNAFAIQNSGGGAVLNEDTTANTLNISGNINIAQTIAPSTGSFTATPSSGSGLTSSTTYYYAVTFVTASGQTSLGAVIAATAATTGLNDQMSLTNIPVSSSSLVTARKIYRTKAASSSSNGPFYLVSTIANNTTTTYTDSVADASLGVTAPTINQSSVIEENNTQIINVSTGSDDNEFFGVQSGASLSGNSTIAIANTGVGYASLQDETTAQYNTAVGFQALQATTSGSYNAALGMDASLNNTTGTNNTAFGSQALAANTTGVDNVALGSYSLNSLNAVSNTASYNTAVGYGAQQGNNEGIQNTSVGYQSGYNFGNGSAAGNNNTAIGYDAGDTDGLFSTLGSISNSTAIGYDAQVQSSNSIVLGGAGANAVNVGIGTTSPTNLLSVSPVAYSTGTAGTGGTFSVTVTGTGTTWTNAMVGDEIIFADGTKRIVTAVGSGTSLTISSATTEPNTSHYRIQQPALQVTSSGNVGVGTVNPTANLQITTQSNTTTAFEVQNASGTNVLDVDTTNGRVGINTSPTTSALQVSGTTSLGYTNSQGALGIYDGGGSSVFGVDTTNNVVYISTTQNANSSVTSNNSLGLTLSSNYWNGSANTTSAYTLQNLATPSSPNYSLAFKNNGGSTVFSLNQNGAAKFQDSSDNTTTFQVQNSAGTSNLFVADTTDNAIGIGAAPTTGSSKLTVAWQSGDTGPTISVGSASVSDGSIAIQAQTYSNTGIQATTSTGVGILGTTSSTTNSGVYGVNNAATNGGAGVTGISTSGIGVFGGSTSQASGVFQSQSYTNTSPTLVAVQGGNAGNPQIGNMFAIQTYGYVSTFTINQNGDTAIIPTNASAATFQVQNPGGASNLFTVNTSAKQIVIGSGTANANNSLLVLNNYDAGEGSEVNGAMFYSTTLNTFRCGQSGQWVDCTSFRYSMNDQGNQVGNAPPSGDTIGNTTTLSTFSDQYSVPANDCIAGRTYQVQAGGVYSDPSSDTGTNARFLINLMWGSTTIGVQAGGSLTPLPTAFYSGNGSLTNAPWSIQATLVCYTNHAGGTSLEVNGTYSFDDAGNDNAMTDGITDSSIGQTVTTGSSQNLSLQWQWGQTFSGQSITMRNFTVNAYGP